MTFKICFHLILKHWTHFLNYFSKRLPSYNIFIKETVLGTNSTGPISRSFMNHNLTFNWSIIERIFTLFVDCVWKELFVKTILCWLWLQHVLMLYLVLKRKQNNAFRGSRTGCCLNTFNWVWVYRVSCKH